MKRSTLFGMLGTLWAVLFIALNYTISLTYISSLHDQAWHIWDYRFIAAAWFLLGAFGMDAFVSIPALFCLWIWIRLLRRFGFTAVTPGRYMERLRAWKSAQGGFAAVILKAAVVCAAAYGADKLADFGSGLLDIGDPIPYYSLGFARGILVWTLIEAGPVVPLTFALFSLAHALFTYGRISLLPRRLLVPAAGLACFFAALLAGYVTADRLDTYRTIQDVSGITREPNPVTLIVLGEGAPSLLLDKPFPSLLVTSPIFVIESPLAVSYCASNDDAVCRYIEDRAIPSVQGLTAHDYLVSSRLRLFDMDGLLETLAGAWEDTGEPIYWHLCVNYIVNGRSNRKRLELLHRITDRSRYVINGRSAMRLAPAFARYGELDEARRWFDKGVRTAANYSATDMLAFRPPATPPFSDGTIRGRVSIPAVGVGLIRAKAYRAYKQDVPEESRTNFLLLSIVDGMKAGPDGSFEFAGLPAGEYVLVLSIPGKDDYAARKMPGVITISKEKPAADVGMISLAEKTP